MTLERRTWHIATALSALMLVLSLRITYWPLVRRQDLQPVALDPLIAAQQYRGATAPGATAPVTLDQLPQPVVQRTVSMLKAIDRGTIYDRLDLPLAESQRADDGTPSRTYSVPSLAHVIGYVSRLGTGVAGLEYRLNDTLLGLDRLDSRIGQMIHLPTVGSDVYLTIDRQIQTAAAEALGARRGAVVVLDAHSGAILAMVSAPGFDPNRVTDPDYLAELASQCDAGSSCAGALFNRAAEGLYVPGSTWKTVSLAAALESGQARLDRVFDFGLATNGCYWYKVGGGSIADCNHLQPQLNLTQAYAYSANAAFARLGEEMPAETLIQTAARFGFSRTSDGTPPVEIAASAAQLAGHPADLRGNAFLRASTAIGQGELLASPLNMALVAATVVNHGDLPRPHLIRAIRAPSGSLLHGEPSGAWLAGAMSPPVADQVRAMMLDVVQEGTGVQAAVPGLTVGGKTGTAQVSGAAAPHAWFIGFAQQDQRAIAIAVIVENGGEGSEVAAPIFAEVARAAAGYVKGE